MRRCTIIIRVTEELLKSVFVKQCHHVGRWEGILSDKYSRDPSQLILSDKYNRDPSQLILSDKYSRDPSQLILSDKYSRDPSQLIVSDKYSRDPSQLIFSDKYSTTETLIEGFGFKLSWLHTNV